MECLKCRQKITGHDRYGLHEQCFLEWFKVDPSNNFVSIKQRSSQSQDPGQDPEAKISMHNISFFHGKFRKYSADLANENYILKMRETKNAPELPEVEFLCNQIASEIGLPVPEYYYINFYSDKVFVTKVFIKKNGGNSNLEHIYKFLSDEEYDCETLIKIITDQTQRPYDVDVFLNTLLFDALIGNHDRHGRNLAFIVTPSKIVLSPIYDNVSYLSLESGRMLAADFNPTGRIATKNSLEPSMLHYVEELIRLNYMSTVKLFLRKINLSKIDSLIDQSYYTAPMKCAFKKLLHKRHKELLDAL